MPSLSLPSPSAIVNALFPKTKHGASAGCELVSLDGRVLPLIATHLRAEARGGIARFVLEQTFRNSYAERLHVTYRMPLPADGAVSGYAFEIGERTITGVVDRKRQARERFERAVSEGKTAALLEQERADIFTQQIGNVPPSETIVAKITVDAKLVWLPEGEWELRFPTVIGPRYIGQHDTINDARATHVKVTEQPLGVKVGMTLSIADKLEGKASSPSHAIEKQGNDITLAAGARLDRDLVVRWPVATPSAGLSVTTARPADGDHAYGLITIVPPARSAKAAPIARDLIVLLDTSGSMSGIPLDKAKAVIALLLGTLTERDRFELIEFNNAPSRYLAEPQVATASAVQAAIRWVNSRVANGGTEIREGVIEALRSLRIGAQRQVIAVTDGYVGGEQQILRVLHDSLPRSCRLHVLGVGSAVNRSLAVALARVGRGAEVIVGPDEDPERSAKRLLDRTALPMLTNVTIAGDAVVGHVPAHIPDVFEGAPLVAAVALSTEGGEIIVKGETADGPWEQRSKVLPLRAREGNQGICALYGREAVADLEARALLEEPSLQIEELGLQFQIATRFTSWIAVDESRAYAGPERTENVPQEVPHGTKASSFGLRAAGTGPVPLAQVMQADFDDESVEAAYSSRAMTRAGVMKSMMPMAPAGAPPASSAAPLVPRGGFAARPAPSSPTRTGSMGGAGGGGAAEGGPLDEGDFLSEGPTGQMEERKEMAEAPDLGARSAPPRPGAPLPVTAMKTRMVSAPREDEGGEAGPPALAAPAPRAPSPSPVALGQPQTAKATLPSAPKESRPWMWLLLAAVLAIIIALIAWLVG